MSEFRTFLFFPVKLICMLSHADKSKELYSSSQLLSDQDAFKRRIQTEQAGMTETGNCLLPCSHLHIMFLMYCVSYQPWEMLYF